MTVANVVATALCRRAELRLDRARRLQFLRIFQQLDHALEQSPRPTAIQAAMIEAQGDLRFRFRNEFLFCSVPRRSFLSNTEPENHRLIGQGNWRAPVETKGSEVRNGRDSAGSHLAR